MIYVFGDIHFSCLRPWNIPIGNLIIKWFKTRFNNENKTNVAIFLGDITEKDLNAGNVIDQVDELFNFMSSKFKEVYILMGNHDLKLYRGEYQHSLKFLQRKYNIKIIDEPETLLIDNHLFRCLPYAEFNGVSLENYYSNLDFTKEKTADITIGHWNLKNPAIGLPIGVNGSKLNTKNIILGHIHTRLDSIYTGSIAPNKISEYTPDVKRVFKIVSNNNITEEEIPHFVKYETINYPNEIKKKDEDCITIYNVIGLKSVQEAQSYYKNCYIKSVEFIPEARLKLKEKQKDIKSDFIEFKDTKESINSFLKETNYPCKRKVYNILINLFK